MPDAIDAARRLCAGPLVEHHSLASSARTRRAPEAEMGTPVLVGAGRKGNQRPALVGAAVDLGLQFGSDGIQGLLEVRVVTTAMGLLEAFPGRKGAGGGGAGHVPA